MNVFDVMICTRISEAELLDFWGRGDFPSPCESEGEPRWSDQVISDWMDTSPAPFKDQPVVDELLTVDEFAQLMEAPTWVIFKLIFNHEFPLPTMSHGGKCYWHQMDLLRFGLDAIRNSIDLEMVAYLRRFAADLPTR